MTSDARRRIAQAAIAKSLDVRARRKLNLDTRMALDIYEVCHALGISVRFVGISMEGMYVQNPRQILISALRPYQRRAFTCAHELGHHLFGHGSTIDELVERAGDRWRANPDELLVQLFAGFLLMPVLGVRRAFAARGWDVRSADPGDFLTVASSFGVSYQALVTHLASSLDMLPAERARALGRIPLPKVRETLIGARSDRHLVVVDHLWSLPTVDVEVGTDILLPPGSEIADGDEVLARIERVGQRGLFRATTPGACKIDCPGRGQMVTRIVRVARFQYVGLSQYRFLDGQDDWDDEDEEL